MKLVFTLILLIIVHSGLSAQITLTGRVIDNTKRPLGYAGVSLLNISTHKINRYKQIVQGGSHLKSLLPAGIRSALPLPDIRIFNLSFP